MSISTNELVIEGLYRISETARFLGISRSHVYQLIKAGVLPTIRIGRSRRIPIKAVHDFAANSLVCDSVPQK